MPHAPQPAGTSHPPRRGSAGRRAAAVADLFGRLTADEQRYLADLLTGQVRQGALDGVLLAAIAGALVMALVGSVRLFAVNRRVRKLEKERERIKSTLR